VKALTRKERAIGSKYRKLMKAREKAGAQYDLADRLALDIATRAGGDGKIVRISTEGKAIQVVDNYQAAILHPKRKPEQMPKAWAHAAVRQFEFDEVTIAS
jgi:hypothetical protein